MEILWELLKYDRDTKQANVVDKMTEETSSMQGKHKSRFFKKISAKALH